MKTIALACTALFLFCAFGRPEAAVAQRQDISRNQRRSAAVRLLASVDNPSTELKAALTRDSLHVPGGLWRAAALLQAELSAEQKKRIIGFGKEQKARFRQQGRRERTGRPKFRGPRQETRRVGARAWQQDGTRRDVFADPGGTDFRDIQLDAAQRSAVRKAWAALRDSALTVQARRDAMAQVVHDAMTPEQHAARERRESRQMATTDARNTALGLDAQKRASIAAVRETTRLRADSLRSQVQALRESSRSLRKEHAAAMSDLWTPAQQEIMQLQASLSRIVAAGSIRSRSRKDAKLNKRRLPRLSSTRARQ